MFETLTSAFHAISQSIFRKRAVTQHDFETIIHKMREALLMADVPQSIVEELLQSLEAQVVGKKLIEQTQAAEQISHALVEEVKKLLGPDEPFPSLPSPSAIMLVGLQGSGKTTSLVKLAYQLRKKQPTSRILTTSLDFQRPAAREQLKQLSRKAGIDYYETHTTTPHQAAHEIIQYQAHHRYDTVYVDTAGRLHTDQILLNELHEIAAIIRPHSTLLALDAMTGQSSLRMAEEFKKVLPLTGGIITKTDSGSRAGVALAFRKITGKPLFFVGTGEGVEDLQAFVPQRVVQRLFGEGDFVSLAERVESRVSAASLAKTQESLMKGTMNLDDFAAQLHAMSSFGPLTSLTQYLPAGFGFKITPQQAHEKEREMKGFRAILTSMTPQERTTPKILTVSRKRRVARGAGVLPAQVDKLLITFEEMQGYAKLVKNLEKGSFNMPNTKRK